MDLTRMYYSNSWRISHSASSYCWTRTVYLEQSSLQNFSRCHPLSYYYLKTDCCLSASWKSDFTDSLLIDSWSYWSLIIVQNWSYYSYSYPIESSWTHCCSLHFELDPFAVKYYSSEVTIVATSFGSYLMHFLSIAKEVN